MNLWVANLILKLNFYNCFLGFYSLCQKSVLTQTLRQLKMIEVFFFLEILIVCELEWHLLASTLMHGGGTPL